MKDVRYLLDGSLLRAGDIILTSAARIPSAAIRAVTKGGYSHAILYVGGSSYIHSDLSGVHAGNLQRMLIDSPSRVAVLRLSDSAGGPAIEAAIVYARRMVGTQYSKREAAASVMPTLRTERSNRQFCSRLVAQAYDQAGVRLVSDPAYCTPSDIFDSPLVSLVSNCVRLASREEIEFAEGLSPLELQLQITNRFFSDVRLLTGADIQHHEQLAWYVQSNPDCDAAVSELLLKSGYLDIWRMDVERNPWRYDLEEFLSQERDPHHVAGVAKAEVQGARELIRRFEHQRQQYAQLNARFPRRYYEIERDLYELLIGLHRGREETARRALHMVMNSAKDETWGS